MAIVLLNSSVAKGKEVASITINPFDASTGTNGLLIVTVSRHLGTSVDGVTFNGVAMTKLTGASASGTSNELAYFYTVNPNATGSIVASFTGPIIAVVCASYWSGVDQVTPFDISNSASGISTTPSVTLTGVAPNTVALDGAEFFVGSAPSVGPGQTQIVATGINSVYGAQSYEAQAGTDITMSWTSPSSGVWYIGAATLNPAGSGGLTINITGSLSGSSIVTGALNRTVFAGGSLAGISAVTGLPGRDLLLTASSSALSSGSGALSLTHHATGATAGLFTTSALARIQRRLAGTITAGGTLTGSVTSTLGLGGSTSGISGATATPSIIQVLIGSLSALCAYTGTAFGSRSMTGVIAGVCGTTGLLGLNGGISGTAGSLSAFSGAITTSTISALTGGISGLAVLSGAPFITRSLGGTILGSSPLSAGAGVSRPVQGAVNGITYLTAGLTAQAAVNIYAQMGALSTLAGGVAMGLGASGLSSSAMSLTGEVHEIISFAGLVSGAASAAGLPVLVGPLSAESRAGSPRFDVTRYGGGAAPIVRTDSGRITVTQDNNYHKVTK